MNTKRTLTSSAALLSVALVTASLAAAASAPRSAAVLIRHQTRGCHSWSVNGGTFKPSQTLKLAVNGSLTITNNDVMPQRLVETSGPSVRMQEVPTPMGMGLKGHFGPGMMAHMGAITKVSFPTAGVYVFTTKAGEDYMPGMKTIGEDNVLKLVVRVR
jgi:hypothetical protein